jgi:hypothetical protein
MITLRLVLILALLILPVTSHAEAWVEIFRTEKARVYYDGDSARKNSDGMIDVDLKWQYSDIQRDGDYDYITSIEKTVFECGASRFKLLTATYFDVNGNKIATKKM